MRLPSGIHVDDRIGIDGDLDVTEGYDTPIDPLIVRPPHLDADDECKLMSREDQIALGEEMVRRWAAFLERARK